MAHRHVLAYFICAFGLVAGQSLKYALIGQEVILMPSISGHPDDILWKHNGNKVVEFDGQQDQQVFGTYKERVTLGWTTADLTIKHLRYEDSGDYELEITIARFVYRYHFKLQVIDKVAKPNISCEMIDGSDKHGIQATLMCSAESNRPQSLTQFEWSSRPGQHVSPGPNLTISLGDEHDDEVYICSVSNRLSNDTATFTAKDCYPEKSSSVGLIVGLVILSVFIVLLLCLVYMYRRKLVEACCKKGKTGDLENPSPPAPVEESETRVPLIHREPNDSDSEHRGANHSDLGIMKGNVKAMMIKFEENNIQQKFPADKQKGKNAYKPLFSPDPEPTSHVYVNTEPVHQVSKDQEADADTVREPTGKKPPPCDSFNSEEANKPDLSEDMQFDVQSSTAPEQTESEKGAEDAKSTPANCCTSPSMTQSSPHRSPEDPLNLKKDANSDQVTGEKNHMESMSADESNEEKQSSTNPVQKGSETTVHEQDSHLTQGEIDTREDNQHETDKPVSEDGEECHSADEAQNQSVDTSPQPQSTTLTTPDNSNTNTCQESPDTAQTEPEQESKTTDDSDESEKQADSSTAEEDKGEDQSVEEKKEVQCGPKEESLAT